MPVPPLEEYTAGGALGDVTQADPTCGELGRRQLGPMEWGSDLWERLVCQIHRQMWVRCAGPRRTHHPIVELEATCQEGVGAGEHSWWRRRRRRRTLGDAWNAGWQAVAPRGKRGGRARRHRGRPSRQGLRHGPGRSRRRHHRRHRRGWGRRGWRWGRRGGGGWLQVIDLHCRLFRHGRANEPGARCGAPIVPAAGRCARPPVPPRVMQAVSLVSGCERRGWGGTCAHEVPRC